MSNKYGSVRLTYTSNPLFNALLSTKGTPPADINFVAADFTAQFLYCEVQQIGTTEARIAFAISDHPRIVGFGLFCNMADGLMQITDAETFQDGIVMSLTLGSYNAAGALQDTLDIRNIKVPELNQIFETDFLMDVGSVDPTDNHLRIVADCNPLDLDFATISIDPAFADKAIIFRPVVIIESNQLPSMDD